MALGYLEQREVETTQLLVIAHRAMPCQTMSRSSSELWARMPGSSVLKNVNACNAVCQMHSQDSYWRQITCLEQLGVKFECFRLLGRATRLDVSLKKGCACRTPSDTRALMPAPSSRSMKVRSAWLESSGTQDAQVGRHSEKLLDSVLWLLSRTLASTQFNLRSTLG
eukprot:TRINITY_DN10907_c0_g1_i2.p1 TRINITY_DN10907_c0_g1~~TRINITY_DN10907_c0_g1_i2.p1  ORF type:complete len:167 (-),score=15.82 TRINITY_DN10907_c0_g1_i2:2490-2990(-)